MILNRILVSTRQQQNLSRAKQPEPGNSNSGWRPSGWVMGKGKEKTARKTQRRDPRQEKANERQERARLRKDRQRNGYYCSDADDREFEAQARVLLLECAPQPSRTVTMIPRIAKSWCPRSCCLFIICPGCVFPLSWSSFDRSHSTSKLPARHPICAEDLFLRQNILAYREPLLDVHAEGISLCSTARVFALRVSSNRFHGSSSRAHDGIV